MGVVDGRCTMILAAGTTTFTADCPGFLLAIEALHVFTLLKGCALLGLFIQRRRLPVLRIAYDTLIYVDSSSCST
jgi:hypothetical protein